MLRQQYCTERFVHRGHELVFDTYGEGERLLVYMHGLLLDAELNRGIAGALAEQGNRVVLLDLLGHGRSDKPTHASAYRIDSYATQVFALLDELGADNAVLGGDILGVERFAWDSLPMADVIMVKQACGVTVNDVVLAIATRALRREVQAAEWSRGGQGVRRSRRPTP